MMTDKAIDPDPKVGTLRAFRLFDDDATDKISSKNLKDEDEKKKLEALKADLETHAKLMTEKLGDKAEDVIIDTSVNDQSANMERTMKAQILRGDPKHSIMPGILELTEKDDLQYSRRSGIGFAADLRPIRLRFPDRNLAGYAIARVCNRSGFQIGT